MAKTGGNQSFFPLFSCAGCNLLQSVGQNTNIITDQKRDLIMICILWIFLGAVCLYFIAGITAAVYIHCRLFNRRYEGNPKLKYFRAEDFEGLAAEEVSFISDGGQTLRGFLYTEENVSPKALIVFCHGFGAGHLSYTTEINTLARAGYAVLGYDGTGCGRSGGKYFRGFDQGPADLRAALRYADGNKKIASLPRVLVGHSWGAFTVMNGYDAARAIRASGRPDAQVPIIAMTADAFAEDVQRCHEAGMNAHVAKPIDVRELVRLLQRYVRRA